MVKKIRFSIFTLVLFLTNVSLLISQIVPRNDAEFVARKFFTERINAYKKVSLQEVKVKDYYLKTKENIALYHVFNIKNGGYVIVAATSRVVPVLAYSFNATYTDVEMPANFKAWMGHYERQILYAETEGIVPSSEISKEWNRMLSEDDASFKEFSKQKSVLPLISSRWNQGNYYNGMCPQDAAGPGGRAYAGCVATAMGQLMYYHRWPLTGIGSYAYQHPVYGTIQADFENSVYDWEGMANTISRPNKAIAQLLHHLGVSVDMNYGPNGSGMWNHSAARSMRNYFKYCPETEYIFRDSTTLQWDSILIANLDASKPLYYAGWTQEPLDSSGHAFVCDGYQGFDYFHFDWGWGGAFNGYFYLHQLTPGGADFNFRQEVIKDVFPDTLNFTYPYYCTGQKVMTDIVGSINNGSALQNYENNTSCEWLIAPVLNVNNIKISFDKLDTENGNDLIKIYNGDNSSAPLIGTYSGTSLPSDITINGKKAFVTFTSDDTITAQGFSATYNTTLPIYCTALTTINELSDTISDGSDNYPYNYISNCRWRINPPDAQSITVTFIEFNTEEDIDYLEVYDMSTSPTSLVDRFTGNSLPPVKTYDSGNIMFWFKSNTYNPGDGWKFFYSSSTSAIKEDKNIFTCSLFPNPASKYLNLEIKGVTNEDLQMQIFTANGQLVHAKELTNSLLENGLYHIDLATVTAGFYFVKVSSTKYTLFKKLIVY